MVVKKSGVVLSFSVFILSFLILPQLFAQTIETIDGVRVVHNEKSKWGKNAKVDLEFIQQIGEFETSDENYMFYKMTGMCRDKNGNIYILDAGNYRIQKFDPNGKYLATIGRKGHGPSEFNLPNGLEIDSEGNLYVCNIQSSRVIFVQVLSPDKKEIRRFRLPQLSDLFWRTNSGNFLTLALGKVDEDTKKISKRTSLLYLLDENGSIVKEFGDVITIKQEGKEYSPNGFDLAVDSQNNIYLTFNNQNRIEKYNSDCELLWKADRPINYKVSYGTKKVPFEIMGETIMMEMPDNTYVSKGIGIDHKNRIWIKTYKKQKDEGDSLDDYIEFEIYDSEGILLGKLPIPQKGSMYIFSDRLYLLDSSEEMCIYEYKIVEK